MPVYGYKAKKGPKEIVHGEIMAGSQDEVVNRLDAMDLVAINIFEKTDSREVGMRGSAKQALNRPVKVKTRDIDRFTWQLASLIKAHVPVLRSLSLISRQTENKELRAMALDLEKQIQGGKMLSEAMQEYPRSFDSLYLSMVKSGEMVGTLDESLYRLAEHRDKQQAIRKKIQSAMAYPALMAIVGIGTIFVMLTCFLPKLARVFENINQALPLPTKILIGLSNFMSANWFWFLFAVVFLFAALGRARPGSKKKFFFDVAKLTIPFMKKFVVNAEIAKFCRTLGLLIKSRITLYESLNLAVQTLDNEVLKNRLQQAGLEIINQGVTLSSSLNKISLFPKFAVNMIEVGEEGGRLDQSLDEIADSYEKEFEQAVKIVTSLLEPMLILIVGSVVGFIVFAMLLPIFNIGGMSK